MSKPEPSRILLANQLMILRALVELLRTAGADRQLRAELEERIVKLTAMGGEQ
jgi:hypothetical protein